MTLGPGWLRERWRRRSVDRDVDDELAFHLEMRAGIYEARGMAAREARDTALRRFGDIAHVRERCIEIDHRRERRMKRLELLSALRQDARYAFRRLRSAPGFTIAVLLMLSLGVGATTAVFSIVNAVLLRPLPFPDAERLVALSHTVNISGVTAVDQSDASFLLYQRHATLFENMGASRVRDVNLGAVEASATEAERVSAAGVSASFLRTLRVVPLRGRGFVAGEDRTGAPRVVVIGEVLWRRKFGADPAIIGRRVVVDGAPREVVGILPSAFHYPSASTELWYPIAFDPMHASVGSFNYTVVGRLRPNVTRERARAELARLLPSVIDEYPGEVPRAMFEQVQVRPVVTPLRDVVVGDVGRLLWILLGAVALVLLVACANVASLFLVRAEGARRELAVRTALGAGGAAIIAQYVSEGLLLALGGGIGGVLVAWLGVGLLGALPNGFDLPRAGEVRVDGVVLLFAFGATLFSALAISLLPVLRSRTLSIASALRDAGRAATAGPAKQRTRSALVVAQVALALVLMAGSGLMARSFARLRDVSPGLDPRNVLTMRLALPAAKYESAAKRMRFYDELLPALQAIPGVAQATVTESLPLGGDYSNGAVWVEDHPLPENSVPPVHDQVQTGSGLFAALGIPLLAGRTFGPQDATRPSLEVVVSRAFAQRYWKDGSPIGKRIRPGIIGPWYTIVGMVGDIHLHTLDQPVDQAIYLPLVTPDKDTTWAPTSVAVVVRGAGDLATLGAAVRQVVRTIDPSLPTYDERPMARILAGATARTRLTMLMLGVASGCALLLGAVGLYGVMAYGVSLRRREIGVRIALGARPTDVGHMVSRDGILLAAVGVGFGLAATIGVTRFLRGLLFGVSPTDPLTLGGTCLLLFGVALLASWLPARRAAAVDPAEALRRE